MITGEIKEVAPVSGTVIDLPPISASIGDVNITVQTGGAVNSVNGQQGDVMLTAKDVGAVPTVPSSVGQAMKVKAVDENGQPTEWEAVDFPKDGYTPVKGVDYFDGKDGKDGRDGQDGHTPVKGVDYFDGKDGVNGKDGYTPIKGVDYFDGKDGKDGINGKDGADGKDGINGKDGADGFSPTVTVEDIQDGHRVTITDKNGTKSFDVLDGKDGQGGGGASVQADWSQNDPEAPDYVKGRTHWAEKAFEDMVYDGNNEGRDSIDLSLVGLPTAYKISDYPLTREEMLESSVEFKGIDDSILGLDLSMIEDYCVDFLTTAGVFYLGESPLFFVVSATQAGLVMGALPVPSAGTYFVNCINIQEGETVTICVEEKVHKLDEKYIPELPTYAKTTDLKSYLQIEQLTTLLKPYIEDDEYSGVKILDTTYFPNVSTIGNRAFAENDYFNTIDCPNATSVGNNAFYSTSIKEVVFPRVKSIGEDAFRDCYSLEKLDFHRLTTIGFNAFCNCVDLKALIIRTNSVPDIDRDAFFLSAIYNSTGYIYVPSSMVDRYKTDKEWSIFADQIRAIEDYPDICR